MKTKTFLLLCLFLGIQLTNLSAQTLQKGAVLVISTYSFVLKPDVTMNQFLDFYINRYNPEYEKCYPGLKIFVLGGDRGENKNQIGELWYFDSVKIRDKYWPIEGDTTSTEFDKAAAMKLRHFDADWNKYIVYAKRVYTDWIIK